MKPGEKIKFFFQTGITQIKGAMLPLKIKVKLMCHMRDGDVC